MRPVVAKAACALALVLATPAPSWACPVCFSAKDDASRQAFIDTTMFLTLLPLAMLGGLLHFVVRRMRAHDEAPASGHVAADSSSRR